MPFPIIPTQLASLLLLFLLPTTIAFEALPFVQIDEQFYLRLAQCQAKCQERFPMIQTDPTASTAAGASSVSASLELCQQGCLDADSPSAIFSSSQQQHQPLELEQSQQSQAFAIGQQFFHQSSHKNAVIGSTPAESPLPQLALRVRPLCVQTMMAQRRLEAQLAVDMAKPTTTGKPQQGTAAGNDIRFVVKWRSRRRRQAEEEAMTTFGEETQEEEKEPRWITASIEPSPVFQVASLRPGLLHQFQAQPVSTDGPQGAPALSEWLDFGQLAERGDFLGEGREGPVQLNFFSQYNAEHGVAAWVRWRREEEPAAAQQQTASIPQKPVLSRRLRHNHHRRYLTTVQSSMPMPSSALPLPKPVVFPSCRLQIEWTNKSSRAVQQLHLDGSDGFLLRNLAFGSQYSVQLTASNWPNPQQETQQHPIRTSFLDGTFLSMRCVQVFGPGSLECEPEQVHGLSVRCFADNASALISWRRPETVANILLYELSIEPIVADAGEQGPAGNGGGGCHAVAPRARIVSADADFAVLSSLPQEAVCAFEARLTVYDLLGRDAAASTRFQCLPPGLGHSSSSSSSGPLAAWHLLLRLEASMLALLAVLLLVPIAGLVTLVCTFQGARRHKPKWRQTTTRPLAGIETGGGCGRKAEDGGIRKTTLRKKLDEWRAHRTKRAEEKSTTTEAEAESAGGKRHHPQSPQSSIGTEVTTVPAISRKAMAMGRGNGSGGGSSGWTTAEDERSSESEERRMMENGAGGEGERKILKMDSRFTAAAGVGRGNLGGRGQLPEIILI